MAEPHSPAIPVKLALKCRSLEAILDETFLSVSTLREVLRTRTDMMMADRTGLAPEQIIIKELKKLSELKHRYTWQCHGSTEVSQTGTPMACSDGWSSESEGSYPRTGESVGSLKLELQRRDAEIQNLNVTVERLVAKKEKLERRVQKLSDRKGPSHGSCGNWDRVMKEELLMAARVVQGEADTATQIRHSTGNGVLNRDEKGKLSVNSERTGEEQFSKTVLLQAKGNGLLGRPDSGVRKESPRKERQCHAAKNGAVKPSNGGSEKRGRRRGDAVSPSGKQAGSELQRVLNGTVMEVAETVADFCKVVYVHMKRAKWEIEEGAVEWVMESHKMLAVQSYVCMRMFTGFEHEDFYMSGRLSWLLDPVKHREECRQQFEAMVQMVEEPLDLLAGVAPDSAFGQFCRKKFLQIFPARMEEALLGDLRHRHCLVREEAQHPHWSRFYQAFARMAKAIWTMHKLAFSLDPRVSIFQAEKGAEFSPSFMESHVPNLELASDMNDLVPKVAFTVMPGLRSGKQVLLRCRVYLNGMKMSSPARSRR